MTNDKTTKIFKVDRIFLIYIFVLLGCGLVALTSASGPIANQQFGDTYYFIKKQVLLGVIPGVVFLLLFARINYNFFRKQAWPIYALAILLLILVFVPGIGATINGARSWIKLGAHVYQPAEFCKFAVIAMAAMLLSQSDRKLSDWQNGLLPVLAVLAPAAGLILMQPDLGTLSILAVIIFGMLFLAKVPNQYLLILGLLVAAGFLAMIIAAPYRVQRFTTFLHPELDPAGKGYQINQSFLAVGSGGVWGLGVGHSRQKFQYLPEVASDSIFAVIAEEIGFIFSTLFILLILLICWRGLQIAKNAPDSFGRLFAGGVIIWFGWQSFLNIGAIIGILPLTGVPLPLVSNGGSAMSILLLSLGVVLSISRSRQV